MPRNTDDATDASPANQIASIHASTGTNYRALIDASLENVGQMAAVDEGDMMESAYPSFVADAAETLRDRNATVYRIESLAEAVALVAACQYTIRGRYATDANTRRAVERVLEAAEDARDRMRAETERVTGNDPLADHADHDAVTRDPENVDDIDRGEGVVTDGGETVDPGEGESRDGEGGTRPVPPGVDHPAESPPADSAPKVSGVTVDASSGIRPPANVVAFAEDDPCVGGLRTGTYDHSGEPWIDVFTHSLSAAAIPDGWSIRYVADTPETMNAEPRFKCQVRITPGE